MGTLMHQSYFILIFVRRRKIPKLAVGSLRRLSGQVVVDVARGLAPYLICIQNHVFAADIVVLLFQFWRVRANSLSRMIHTSKLEQSLDLALFKA